jgi:hypothetical protein
MLAVVPALLLPGAAGPIRATSTRGDIYSTSISSSDTGGDADADSAVIACQDFQEAVNDWSSHAIQSVRALRSAGPGPQERGAGRAQDIVETGGALLVALTESDSTFAASIKNFDKACAAANH